VRESEWESLWCAGVCSSCVCVREIACVSVCGTSPCRLHSRAHVRTHKIEQILFTHLVSGDGQPGPVRGTHHPGAGHEVLVGTSAAARERAPVRNAHTSSVYRAVALSSKERSLNLNEKKKQKK
jgi:hypothetical protein